MKKTIKYKIVNEGSEIIAASPRNVIHHLKNGSRFASNESLVDFMRGFSNRYYELTGNVVRFDNPNSFVADLAKFGYLEKI